LILALFSEKSILHKEKKKQITEIRRKSNLDKFKSATDVQ